MVGSAKGGGGLARQGTVLCGLATFLLDGPGPISFPSPGQCEHLEGSVVCGLA